MSTAKIVDGVGVTDNDNTKQANETQVRQATNAKSTRSYSLHRLEL